MSAEICPAWLESLGMVPDDRRPLAWLMWLPDDVLGCDSYLQLVAPRAGGRIWTAELINVVEGEWIAAAIPRPIVSRGNVLFLITALGGRVFAPHELQAA